MPRRHKHWAKDHPRYEGAPWCRYPRKADCDRAWTEFMHGHVGQRCVKAIVPSKTRPGEPNKIETCTIIVPPDPAVSWSEAIDAARAVLDAE